jgi:two-component system, NtrC family, sensor histidine kinase HydH
VWGLRLSHFSRHIGLGLRRTFAVSLIVATLACLMAAIVLVRQRVLLREVQREWAIIDAVLTGMGDGVVVLGAEGTLQMANPAACKLFGLPVADLVGKQCEATPCGDLLGGLSGASEPLKAVVPRADGTAVSVLATASPVRIAGHGPPGTTLILRDLTECRRLEREKQRNATLAAFGRFASTVAHEIRNPLNAIGVGVQRLEIEGLQRKNGTEPRRLLELIHSEVERLDHILSGFLDLARPRRVKPEPGDLDALLAEMMPLLREGSDAGVRFNLERGGVTDAMFDAHAIRQVVLNLVRNAREAAGERGHVAIVTRREENAAVLEVRDDGPGISSEIRDQVFEFGFTTKPTGNGLGLPVVHHLVTEMGGSVEVAPVAGRGTAIQIRLPLADELALDESRRRG